MFYVNSNTPISNNRYFVFVTDTAGLATATASALYKRIEFEYRTLADTNAGFVGEGTTFLSLLQGASFTDVEAKLKVTDIVVMGGRRDTNKGIVAKILPAMETFSNYCKQHFPLAKVWAGMIEWCDFGVDGDFNSIDTRVYYRNVLEFYSKACEYGISYMTNIHYASHYSDWQGRTSLNATGYANIGKYIAQCLLNGSATVVEYQKPTVTYKSGISASYPAQYFASVINNGSVTLLLRNSSSKYCGFDFPSRSITAGSSISIPICDLTGTWCQGMSNDSLPTAMLGNWETFYNLAFNQSSLEARGRLRLTGRTVYLDLLFVGTSQTLTISNVKFNQSYKIIDDAFWC